jgi:hypothetical protein
MNPTEREVVIILVLLTILFLKMSSFIDRDRMDIVYKRMLMRKLRGILLLTLMKTKATGKMQSIPVKIHKTN